MPSRQENDAHIENSGVKEIKGVSVAFKDLTYTVPVKNNDDGKLTILHGISGAFLPGKMTALVGPSGSGKSTLLDVLSGRKNTGTTEGTILMNGTRPSASDLKRFVGYVEQFDTLVGELTVAQMLAYTAALKLPASTTAVERHQRVEEVLEILSLNSCRDTVIGSALVRGISGGQAKRVNIGLAMITRPKILLLDEPTSGLDSRTANEVIELLKQLCHEGNRVVVCTIHSPTGHAFAQFDQLQMLHQGRTIYDGPLTGAQPYFEGLGHKRDFDCSLPEWLVDLTSEMSPTKLAREEDEEGPSRDFAVLFEQSAVKQAAMERFESIVSFQLGTSAHDYKPPGEISKLGTLLRFRMTAHYKNAEFLGTRFGDKIVFALLILSLYYGIGDDSDPQSIVSVFTMLYFVCAICGYGAAAFVPSLTLERALYYRELADGCYKPATYYMSKFVEEAVLAIITSLVFCVIVHFGVALQGSFVIFAVTYYLTSMMGIILAYAIAAIAPNMDAANASLPALVTIWMYFGGFFIVADKIPAGWYWFSWTSFLRYSWGAMMLNEYQGKCNGELPMFFGDDGVANVLEFYGMEGPIMSSIGVSLAMLVALNGIFCIVGILSLKLVRHDKR